METVRRGYEPKDAAEFGPKLLVKLNAAAQELRFLLNRGYDVRTCIHKCYPFTNGPIMHKEGKIR